MNNFIKRINPKWLLILAVAFIFSSCDQDEGTSMPSVSNAEYDDTPYQLDIGNFPEPDLPPDNPLTVEGVKLGKMLFFEPRLSNGDGQACADCHNQGNGFSDTLRFSLGVRDLPGTRQAMGIFNMAWNTNGFFWDGRAELLRHQAILPIQDSLEMDETIDNVIAKLSVDPLYTDQFIRAFGDDKITEDRMGLAMEQFMLSIVSHDSKYDKWVAGEVQLSESEERGRQLYFTEFNPFFPDQSGADCEHCHGGINFENDAYMNNGLDVDVDISDLGRELVTNNSNDRGKFKVPSLRNIALTPPYMHDGRFQTLEEVIDHYNEGIKMSETIDPALIQTIEPGLLLDDQKKEDLKNFLLTLTDEVFLQNPEYKSPF